MLINGIVIHTHAMARLSDEDAVYLIESVVGSLHICKRVRSPTVCEGLQLICEDRNDDRFAVCLCRFFGLWPSRVVWKAVLLLVFDMCNKCMC